MKKYQMLAKILILILSINLIIGNTNTIATTNGIGQIGTNDIIYSSNLLVNSEDNTIYTSNNGMLLTYDENISSVVIAPESFIMTLEVGLKYEDYEMLKSSSNSIKIKGIVQIDGLYSVYESNAVQQLETDSFSLEDNEYKARVSIPFLEQKGGNLKSIMFMLETYDFSANIKFSNVELRHINTVCYNGHTYSIFDGEKIDEITDWESAKKYCEEMGGHLATISSEGENEYLFEYMTKCEYDNAYFGYTDEGTEGSWSWITSEDNIYTNWNVAEPNNENNLEHYAMFYRKYNDGSWNDGDFSTSVDKGGKQFICEWDFTNEQYDDYSISMVWAIHIVNGNDDSKLIYEDGKLTYIDKDNNKYLISLKGIAASNAYGYDSDGTIWFISRSGYLYWWNFNISQQYGGILLKDEENNGVKAEKLKFLTSNSIVTGYYNECLEEMQLPNKEELESKDDIITIKYLIRYDANGGTNAPSEQTKKYGEALVLSSDKPLREGYEFQGWSTSSIATEAMYKAGDSYTGNVSTTLYAVWKSVGVTTEIEEYTPTTNILATTEAITTTQATATTEATTTTQAIATTEAITTTQATATTQVITTTQAIATTQIMLSTTSTPTYQVKYDANGGVNAPVSQTQYYGEVLKLSNQCPSRTGYQFLGWSTSSIATEAMYKAGVNYYVSSNSSIILYAVWKKIEDVIPNTGSSSNITTENATTQNITTADNVITQANNTDSNNTMTESVSKKKTTIQTKGKVSKTYSAKKFKLAVSINRKGQVSYKSSNNKVAQISKDGTITMKNYGKVKITITAKETENYQKAVKNVTLTIKPQSIKGFKVSSPIEGKIVCNWSANKQLSDCEIAVSDNKQFKNVNKFTTKISKKRYQIGGAKRSKKYYVRMRTYTKANGKKCYSDWTSIKTIKVK